MTRANLLSALVMLFVVAPLFFFLAFREYSLGRKALREGRIYHHARREYATGREARIAGWALIGLATLMAAGGVLVLILVVQEIVRHYL